MLIAVIALYVGTCFTSKNKSLNFLLQAFSLMALLALGAVVGNSQNNFSGYVVFLIVSVAPQFLGLFDLKAYLASKQNFSIEEAAENAEKIEENSDAAETYQNEENSEVAENAENKNQEQEGESVATKEKKQHFLSSKGEILNGVASLLTAICVTFAGLYLGLETFYGALFGLATGIALMFLYLALKKEINLFDLLGMTLSFISIGLLVGSVITVVLYSFSLTNILFCLGALILATYIGMKCFYKTKFDNLVYCLATICLLATILF